MRETWRTQWLVDGGGGGRREEEAEEGTEWNGMEKRREGASGRRCREEAGTRFDC